MTLDMFLHCGCGRAIDVPGRNICFECYFEQQEREPTPTSAAIGMTVRLDRDIDREKPCCRNLAIIQPGKAQHAGELRCANCGSHRGWASKLMIDFISETARRFGA